MVTRQEIYLRGADLGYQVTNVVYNQVLSSHAANVAAFDYIPAAANTIYCIESLYWYGSSFTIAGGVPNLNYYDLAATLVVLPSMYIVGAVVGWQGTRESSQLFVTRLAYDPNGATSGGCILNLQVSYYTVSV